MQALAADVAGDKVATFKAEATSGSSGADTGVAGALAINIGLSDARATVAPGATVALDAGADPDGALLVKAENFVADSAKASGKQSGGGKIGVGASIALDIGITTTEATLADNAVVTGAGDITLSAASGNQAAAIAEGGSAGKTAVTPVIAISVINDDTRAGLGALTVGTPAQKTTTLGGTLNVSAAHEGATSTEARGDTESGDTGVGVSLALTIVTDSAVASTARDISAGGAVGFSARTLSSNKSDARASVAGGEAEDDNTESDGVDKKVGSQRSFADGKATGAGASPGKTGGTGEASAKTSQGGGSQGTKVSVAGAVAVTVADSTSDASLPAGRRITAGTGTSDGALTLLAANNTDSGAVADGSATVGGGTGVGVGVGGVAVNVAHVHNLAQIGVGSTVVADGLSTQAVMADRPIKATPASQPVVDIAKNTIFLGAGHGLETGDKLGYDKGASGNTAIGGLTSGTDYYVIKGEAGKIQLAASKANAEAGTAIDLTSVGSGTGHKLKPGLLEFSSDRTFDPAASTVIVTPAKGNDLQTGEGVVYDKGTGSAIGGLTNGSHLLRHPARRRHDAAGGDAPGCAGRQGAGTDRHRQRQRPHADRQHAFVQCAGAFRRRRRQDRHRRLGRDHDRRRRHPCRRGRRQRSADRSHHHQHHWPRRHRAQGRQRHC